MQNSRPSQRVAEDWWAAYRAEMFEMAVRVGAQLDGCNAEALRLFIAAHDVVTAVIVDPDESEGFFTHAIKGHSAMREIVASGRAKALTITALPCRSLEEAEALRLTIGEADLRH